jgi:Rieske Fe-S protein
MTGEDQEHFADYLELERYIEDLQAGHAAHLPTNLTLEHARVYRMAALFRSASPEASQPRPEFIAALQERLLSMNQEQEAEVPPPAETAVPVYQTDQEQSKDQQAAIEQPSPVPEPTTPPRQFRKTRSVSRRALLTGGAAAAASLAVGIGAGSMMDKPQSSQPPAAYKQEELIPTGPTTWLFIAPLAQLSEQAVKFVTDAITGYVMLKDKDTKDATKEPVVALSAACTHMGCIVNWEDNHHQFQCPCHGGLFDEYGQPAKGSPIRYLKPLARLRTKIENGNVYIEVPAQGTAGATNPAPTNGDNWP